MHVERGVVHTFPKAVGAKDLCPCAQKDPASDLKRTGGKP